MIFSNWPLKLTALGLAVVLYVGVAISESTRVLDRPGAHRGAQRARRRRAARRSRRRRAHRVPGLRRHRRRSSPTTASGPASTSPRSQPRAGANTVEVPVDVFPVDPRVRVVGYDPPGVTVRVDEVVSRTLPVEIDHGPLPEGIELGPLIVEPNQVIISGASSRLQNVRTRGGPLRGRRQRHQHRRGRRARGLRRGRCHRARRRGRAGDRAGAGRRGSPAGLRHAARHPRAGRRAGSRPRVDNVSVLPATVTVSGENPAIRQLGVRRHRAARHQRPDRSSWWPRCRWSCPRR